MPEPPEPEPNEPDRETNSAPRRAQIIGTGLIGGSIGAALKRRGWVVTGHDVVGRRAERAVELGVTDRAGQDPDADLVFVATPAQAVGPAAEEALRFYPRAVITDVAGVKGPVLARISDPRFVGGHPMAGSEQEGVDGSDPEMFEGATWVLTPEPHTDPQAFTTVRSVVSSLGANVVELPARRHDDMVAMVSHVPHLTAATLMNLAADSALEHATLLRLAAGGFRDMTRIAAGEPTIWPDVCFENRDGIVEVLDRLLTALANVRAVVASRDRGELLQLLERARHARVNLPAGVPSADDAVELRVPVPDRTGVIAEVTTLLTEMGVNIYDFEIAHSAEGERGVLVMVIRESAAAAVREALHTRDYRSSIRPLGP